MRTLAALILGCAGVLIGALGTLALRAPAAPPPPLALVEIRSWVVGGRGRHMYALITPPTGYENLATIVEYSGAFQRRGYRPPTDVARRDRIVKMPRGQRVGPYLNIPSDNRLEAVYWLPLETVVELERDRVFSSRYFLFGPNSSSGLRAAFESAGVPLPTSLRASGGPLGEFPGVELLPGAEVPPDEWERFGVTGGPEPAPVLPARE